MRRKDLLHLIALHPYVEACNGTDELPTHPSETGKGIGDVFGLGRLESISFPARLKAARVVQIVVLGV